MLKRLVIEKLFGTFDYSIDLKPEGLTVLTGPNGYGKTTILRILEELANRNLFYFLGLHFKKIELAFNELETIIITKNGSSNVYFQIEEKKTSIQAEKVLERITEMLPFMKQTDDIWIDRRNGSRINTKDVLKEVVSLFQREGKEEHFYARSNRKRSPFEFLGLSDPLENYELPKVLLIKEQRLLRRIQNDSERDERYYVRGSTRPPYYEEIIEGYAERLKGVMDEADVKYAEKSRELDSSYPSRLFNSSVIISKEDFHSRFGKIKETQKLLAKYDLSVRQEDISPDFDESNAKALYVYLSDVESKLQVFDQLLNALNLFSKILNSRKFVNKQVAISKKFGLKFTTNDGVQLLLSELSSGEQHEVVLLFDLLFQTVPNTLILIDEPEMSLHVAWQHEFLPELRKIIELRGVTVIVSTHSPQIIGNDWNAVYDLEREKGI